MKERKPIDPEQYAKVGTEDAHQTALFIWASNPEAAAKYPQLRFLFAIPNGGSRGDNAKARMIRGAKLKATGVKSGVPDVMLPIARHGCNGLFIELKRPSDKEKKLTKGRASDKQDEWIEALRNEGYGACICYGWNEARQVIEDYLG